MNTFSQKILVNRTALLNLNYANGLWLDEIDRTQLILELVINVLSLNYYLLFNPCKTNDRGITVGITRLEKLKRCLILCLYQCLLKLFMNSAIKKLDVSKTHRFVGLSISNKLKYTLTFMSCRAGSGKWYLCMFWLARARTSTSVTYRPFTADDYRINAIKH